MKFGMRILATASVAACIGIAAPAYADGNVVCNSGATENWKPVNAVKKKVAMEGWKLLKVLVQGDCYEVYAHNEAGQTVEAFFHPVTLKKLLVLRRGTEIYRAKDFTG